MNLRSRPTAQQYVGFKRSLDVAGGFLALVALSPVIASVALAILVVDGRPVLFFQKRPGFQSRTFVLIKFRTMAGVARSQGKNEGERITPLGRVLRSLSLDELPSLWNILRGDMSFVGPRPLLLDYLRIYTPRHARRHDVRPGLTGLAQVSGRNLLTWKERLDLDVKYVDSYHFGTDLSILMKTVKAVLSRKGVNQSNGATMSPLRPGYDS